MKAVYYQQEAPTLFKTKLFNLNIINSTVKRNGSKRFLLTKWLLTDLDGILKREIADCG